MEENTAGNLFSETNRRRESLNKALYRLDFPAVIKLLKSGPDDPDNIDDMIRALNELNGLTGPDVPTGRLSELFFTFDTRHEFLVLENYKHLILKGLARAITGRLDTNVHEFISDEVHGSQFPLFLGEQNRAIDACRKYLATRKPDPKVYQLLSFAHLRNNQKKQAANAETMAVFLNPLKLDPQLIHHEEIQYWVERFQTHCTYDHDETVQELLVELLKLVSRKIFSNPFDRHFFNHMEKLITHSDPSIFEYKDRILKTVRLLFVLENISLSQDFKKATFTYREILQNLNPRFYEIYMEYIKTRKIR